jgi:uncharacterized protein YndB with AHSA1/START domain
MASNVIHVHAPARAVFDTLLDPGSYGAWVVGSKEIRDADPTWPAPGAAFHHTVGVGPLINRDRTVVRTLEPPRRLVLEACAWPAGTALVELTVTPHGDGTRVELAEHPLRGPGRLVPRLLADPVTYARNAVALCRLKILVESRPVPLAETAYAG